MTQWLGLELAGYYLDEVLGQSELVTVYRAHHKTSGIAAAVQVLQPQIAVDEARFMAWGQTAAQLHHPHLIPLITYGWHDGTGYWVRPQTDGISLATLLQRLEAGHYRLDVSDSLHLVQQLTSALDYLHQQNEIHGAIHPGNIWLCPAAAAEKHGWNAILLDSSLWTLLAGRQPNLLATFTALWPYAAPEQTEGFTPSATSDLYNLTAILFHLVTGQAPFQVYSLEEARYVHNEVTPAIPDTAKRILPQRVIAILRKGLAKQPAQRLQSASHLALAIQQVLDTETLPVGEALRGWLNGQGPAHPSLHPGPAELVIKRDQAAQQVIPLDKPVLTLGRSRKNDICIPEQGVSRHHARVEWMNNGWHLVDLDSTNGVLIGQTTLRPQEPYPWHANEEAQVGGYTLHWQPILPGQRPLPSIPLPPPPASEIPLATAPRRFEEVFAFAFTPQTRGATGPPAPRARAADEADDTDEAVTLITPHEMLEGLPVEITPGAAAVPELTPEPPIVEPATPPEPMTVPPLIEPMTPVAPLPVPLVRLTLVPNEIKLMPGREAFIQVLIANQGQIPERFYMKVEGLPPDWVSIPENQLFLEAGEQNILQINILNTLDKNIEPGQRTFIVRVSPETAPDIVSAVTGYVQIEPCIFFDAELEPEQLRSHVPSWVHIHNSGNVVTTFSILARTEAENDTLQFIGQAGQITLAPGQTGDLPLTVQAAARPLWGKRQTIPFRVQVRANHGDSLIKVGRVDIVPVFPLWLLLAGGLLCLLLTLLLIFLPNL